jgi:hypothetical protein
MTTMHSTGRKANPRAKSAPSSQMAAEPATQAQPDLRSIRLRFLTTHSVLETAARALEKSDACDTEITQEVFALRHGLELLDGACDALSDYPEALETQS